MDKLTLLVKTGSIKPLSMLMGGGQFKKFTIRVNIDVIIYEKMENI